MMPGATLESSSASGPTANGIRLIAIRKNIRGLTRSPLLRNANVRSRRKVAQNALATLALDVLAIAAAEGLFMKRPPLASHPKRPTQSLNGLAHPLETPSIARA